VSDNVKKRFETDIYINRVFQEKCAKLRESVSYVKVHRYSSKHLYSKLAKLRESVPYVKVHRYSSKHLYPKLAKLRESVPYVKVHRYSSKHLYPKLNGYGDIGQRKVWSSCGSTYCKLPVKLTRYPYTAHVRP
jgi:hypothetical protein